VFSLESKKTFQEEKKAEDLVTPSLPKECCFKGAASTVDDVVVGRISVHYGLFSGQKTRERQGKSVRDLSG